MLFVGWLCGKNKLEAFGNSNQETNLRIHACIEYLTIIPRARMGSESIAHEAEGRVGY